MDSYWPGFYRKKGRISANVISATNQKAFFNLEPIDIRVGRKHMFLFSNLNFEKLKNQSSFTLWGILILIPWNQFWQNRSFRNCKNFYGDNQFSFDDKRREFVHSNYSLLHDLTWSRVEIRLVPELLVSLPRLFIMLQYRWLMSKVGDIFDAAFCIFFKGEYVTDIDDWVQLLTQAGFKTSSTLIFLSYYNLTSRPFQGQEVLKPILFPKRWNSDQIVSNIWHQLSLELMVIRLIRSFLVKYTWE